MVVKKYNSFINETLIATDTMIGVLNYLATTKHDKVAKFLYGLLLNNIYKDDELINYLGLGKESNMITYLQTNKRGSRQENFENTQRTSVRVGRAVKKIYDTVKDKFLVDKSIMCNICRGQYERDIIVVESTPESYYEVLVPSEVKDVPTKVTLKGNGIDITGTIRSSSERGYSRSRENVLSIKVDPSLMPDLPIFSYWTRTDKDKKVHLKIEVDFSLSDSDIEKFTNEFISFVKSFRSDESSEILEVRGEEIRKWYNNNNYQSSVGKLGGSCMAHEDCGDYLNIYTENPEVLSMLILKSKENKLVGRALLWKSYYKNKDEYVFFMDRIYTASDSDDNIFINYAIKNGYIYRSSPPSGFKYFKNGLEIERPELKVQLQNYDFDDYPYMDTLYSLNSEGILSNVNSFYKTLRSTEGRWNEYFEDNEDDDD